MPPTFQTVGLVGTGAMGRGIAQLYAQAGHPVRIYDAQPGAAGAGAAPRFSRLGGGAPPPGRRAAAAREPLREPRLVAPREGAR